MNWYPFPQRIKVSAWKLLMSHTAIKGFVWGLEALLIGCFIAWIISLI